jgi:hypothetical protein
MGGVVQRVTNDPPKTEWLLLDVAPWRWTQKSEEAFFFERYDGEMSATSCALLIAQDTREHVFPAIRTKPMPHKPIPEPIIADETPNESKRDTPERERKMQKTAQKLARELQPAEVAPQKKFWWQEK